MVHGLDISFSDIEFDTDKIYLNNMISDTGLVYGLSTWYNSQLSFVNSDDMDFAIVNLKAGYKYLNDDTGTNQDRYSDPNHKAQACGIRIHQSTTYPVSIDFGDDQSIFKQTCIQGIVGCDEDNMGTIYPFTHLGSVTNYGCDDLRVPEYIDSEEEMIREGVITQQDNHEMKKAKAQIIDKHRIDKDVEEGEEMIERVHYFGNVFIMTLLSVIVIGVAMTYYCCKRDQFEHDEDDKYWPWGPRWRRKDFTAYGSV